ncbi:unnamed protein product [Trichogramma brassicae]|uniref:Uncharacterized protein n=1 Tax=Trichogramma brassicae TaxID=86971 RepID=A0A6H5HZM6_9HYME|nr:unnamed protein product [Trichogramma brassicae]
MFDEAIEERKKYEKRVKEEEEFEMKVVKIFNEMKTEMQRSLKEKIKAAKDERMRQIEVLDRAREGEKKVGEGGGRLEGREGHDRQSQREGLGLRRKNHERVSRRSAHLPDRQSHRGIV